MVEKGVAVFGIANGVMLLLFLFALAVQYNDPDRLLWISSYGAAALMCNFAMLGHLWRWAPLLVGVCALGWAAAIAPEILGKVSLRDVVMDDVDGLGMPVKDATVELAREACGLLLIAVWMLTLAAVGPGLHSPRRS